MLFINVQLTGKNKIPELMFGTDYVQSGEKEGKKEEEEEEEGGGGSLVSTSPM